jgi:hypothetical protein
MIKYFRGSDVRASRRWLAGLMILGFSSAQLISLAHACGSSSDTPLAPALVIAAAMPADCPIMADGTHSTGAACDAHCLPREQADKGADVRIAAMAPPCPLVVRVVPPKVQTAMRATPPLARIASPPLSLLFGRFLI